MTGTGVIVISLGTPQSAGEEFGCTWEHLGAPGTAGDKSGSADDKPWSPGDNSGSTSNHSRAVWQNNIFIGDVAGASGNHSYYLLFNDC